MDYTNKNIKKRYVSTAVKRSVFILSDLIVFYP